MSRYEIAKGIGSAVAGYAAHEVTCLIPGHLGFVILTTLVPGGASKVEAIHQGAEKLAMNIAMYFGEHEFEAMYKAHDRVDMAGDVLLGVGIAVGVYQVGKAIYKAVKQPEGSADSCCTP